MPKTETTQTINPNAEHNKHLEWFTHFMDLFIFQIESDVTREELEKALTGFRNQMMEYYNV